MCYARELVTDGHPAARGIGGHANPVGGVTVGISLLVAAVSLVTAGGQADSGLLFRAAFDGSLEARSLGGAGMPVGVSGPEASFGEGRFGQALVCGPEQALVRYRTAGNVMPPSGTISLWVKPLNWTPDDGNFHVFFESGSDGGPTGWLLLYKYFMGGQMLLRYADEQQQVGMATAQGLGWQAGEWHHLAGTWTPEALRLYVDGELAATAPLPVVGQTLADTFALGDNGWHVPHAGALTLLDEVRIYAYPLTEEHIRALAGHGRLTVSRGPGEGEWQAELNLGADADATSATFDVLPASGDAPVKTVRAQMAKGFAKAVLPVADLAPGAYRVRARALDAGGAVIADARADIRRLERERLVLANGHIRAVFDAGTGALVSIEAPRLGFTGRAEAAPPPLFTLDTVSFADHARFYQPGDVRPVAADDGSLKRIGVERTPEGQRLTAEYALAPLIRASVTADLPDREPVMRLRLRIENSRPVKPSEAVRIPRVAFPTLGGLRVGADSADDTLATGYIHGETLAAPATKLPSTRTVQYPGTACVPWQDLYDAAGGLYLGPQTDGTCQLEITAGARDGAVDLGNRWWALLEPGESWESPVVELGVHSGAWHWAADRFRQWALAATPPREQPKWLGECDGWLGMGGPQYTFRDLPKVLDAAQYYGFSYLQLWSEMILGDQYYCYFYPNPDLGTETDLRRGIEELHRRGGHIGFYSNVICFDGAIDQNPQLERKIAERGLTDLPMRPSFYDQAAKSVFVGPTGAYGRSAAGYLDGYWAMDPNSVWWRSYLAGWIKRWHGDYGADVWYLDSFPVHGYGLGPASYSLHLEHPQSLGAGQIGLLKRIREDFDGPMLYEGVACAAFMPYTNWCLGTQFSFGSGAWSRPEILDYSFGDVYPVFAGSCNVWTGIGQIWPDLQPPRHEDAMNFVFLNGERFDTLGLYPADPNSVFGEHVRKLVALRRKVRDVVYQGRFRDVLGLSGMPEKVEARLFVREGTGAVVTLVDRRAERKPWDLRLDSSALRGAPATSVRLLLLDGQEKPLQAIKDGGALVVTIDPATEVCAVRVE